MGFSRRVRSLGLVLWAGACSASPGTRAGAPDAAADLLPEAGTANEAGGEVANEADASTDASPDDGTDATGEAPRPIRWSAPANNFAAAAGADMLAVAYTEAGAAGDGTSEGRLLLQLVDEGLHARGVAIPIDRQPIGTGTRIPTVATDGTDFLVCWSPQDQVRCFRVGPDAAPALFFQASGITPSVVFHAPTWALAHVASTERTSTSEVRLLRLARDGTPVGEAATLPYDNYFSQPVSFVATPSGFALLAGSKTGQLYRLSDDLAVLGAPVDTGLMPWSFHDLAATDDEAALSLAFPYGNALIHVRGNDVAVQRRDCGGKTGCGATVAVAAKVFAVAWWSEGGQVAYVDDIDRAMVPPGPRLAEDGSSIALVSFRSRVVIVARGAL